MSRVRHSLRYATAAVGIALALAGCGAGQISQTAGMEPAVNGGEGDVGPIAVRDIQLAYPPQGVYEPGSTAVVLGTLVNSALTDDELVSITSPAGQVTITGDKSLPAGRSLILEMPAGGLPTSSSRPTTTSSTPTSGTPTSGAPTSGAATSGFRYSGFGCHDHRHDAAADDDHAAAGDHRQGDRAVDRHRRGDPLGQDDRADLHLPQRLGDHPGPDRRADHAAPARRRR
ncbi:hypothetical protein [Kibdelosporangium aridum]|uniref:hypothetical protein n=1 Tax=Kibdelosporangium aridum TaxID=2030 RepID=UPI0035E5FEBE